MTYSQAQGRAAVPSGASIATRGALGFVTTPKTVLWEKACSMPWPMSMKS